MDELKGHISITRPQGHSDDYINIKIVDRLSGIRFVECNMSLANFALALTGHGHVDCTFIPRGLDGIGKTRENKVERVFVPKVGYGKDTEIVCAALAEHEVDGWKARSGDATNHHRIGERTDKGYFVSVNFSRLVETPTAAAQP